MIEEAKSCPVEQQGHYPFSVKIAGVGRCLPKRVVRTAELEAECGLEEGWHRHTHGVEERRWVAAETQSEMGAEAAREAVRAAGIELSELDMIVNASMSFERKIPDGGPLLQRQMGLLDSGIPCISVQASDQSFLAAVDVATSLIVGCNYHNVLVVSSEVLSPILDSCCPEAYTLFGDGAAAAVLTRAHTIETSCFLCALGETYGADLGLMQSQYGYATFFKKLHARSQLALQLQMNAFMELGALRVGQLLDRLCSGTMRERLDLAIVQDWGKHFQSSIGRVMPESKLIWTSQRFGQCGAASIPMALYEAVTTNRLKRGNLFLMAGFGAGMSVYGIVGTY